MPIDSALQTAQGWLDYAISCLIIIRRRADGSVLVRNTHINDVQAERYIINIYFFLRYYRTCVIFSVR